MKKFSSIRTIKFVFSQSRNHKLSMVMIFAIMLIYVGADFVHPFIWKRIINLVSQNQIGNIVSLVIILAIAYLGHRIFRDIAGFFLVRIEAKTRQSTANRAFSHATKLPYKFHVSTFAGSTVKKINRGVEGLGDALDVLTYDLTPIVLTMIISSIIFFKTSIIIGIPLVIGLIIFIVISIILVQKRMRLDNIRNQNENKLSGAIIDSLTNNLTVKTFTGEKTEEKLYARQNQSWAKAATRSWNFESWTSLFQGGFIAILEIMLLSISLYLWKQGSFNVGDIVFVQANMGLLMFPMWTLGRFYRNFRRAEVDMQDLIKLLVKPITIKSAKNAKLLKIQKGEIVFDQVSFSYEKTGREILRDLSLLIRPGEKIALVGQSGAGKSTFVKLLFRFIDPTYGKILIDNQNIRRVDLNSLRQSISLVPQEPLLFHRSILENIKYGRPKAGKQEIIKAAKLAHAYEFIDVLPRKFNTLVGERGIKLSGGERQRIALARIFLENAPILVLDEATSSLDSVSENLIQEALDSLMQSRTTIVIAHRLSTIRRMDRIIVFEKGRIAEMGSHDELVQKTSLYQKLWQSQAGKFVE